MMKRRIAYLITSALMTLSVMGQTNETVDLEGATLGKWTMDFDAAKKLAAETKSPILLDFSGSDWCGWCKIMEENVFTKPEWKAYAQKKMVMVLIDFPQDKTLVPEKYVDRNTALQTRFGVEGFPTFVVLDDDGETELGRLGSGKDKTPASFQAELEKLFRKRAAARDAYTATLSPEAQTAYKAMTAKIAEQKKAVIDAEAAIVAAEKEIEALSESIASLEEEMQEFRVAQLGEEEQTKFHALKKQFETKRNEIMTWLATQPEPNEENTAKFHKLQGEMQTISTELDTY